METRQQTPPTDAPRPPWGDWCGFSPLAAPPRDVGLSPAAFALMGAPVAYVVTGTELLGGGIVPGDTLIVDCADRAPAPGALIVVWGSEDDPEPLDRADLPPSMIGLSAAVLAQLTPCHPVPLVGQYWPRARDGARGGLIDLRALLPGHPAPLGIFDYAFAEQLVGVVAGFYATGARDDSIDWSACDWAGWDWGASIDGVRRHLKALEALSGPLTTARTSE